MKTNYLPFYLYLQSLYHILIKTHDVYMITDLSLLENDVDYLITFLNYIDILNDVKIKMILIHADYIINHANYEKYIKFIIDHNVFLWEYSVLNMNLYKEHYPLIKYDFIPLCYNKYLEDVYKPYKLNIPYNERKYDVVFLGNYSDTRRNKLILKINEKYKLHVLIANNNINEYVNAVENSKIVLNIYSKEYNMPFDYYRFAMLYANNTMIITETPKHVDYNIESNLLELSKYMIHTDYDNIINTIDIYLKKTNEEINKITQDIYNTFKKNNMEYCINNSINNLQI